MGPVAVFAAALLLCTAPLMRGGNRHIALIGLEAVAFTFLLSLWIGWVMGASRTPHIRSLIGSTPGHEEHQGGIVRVALIWILLSSPLWLALAYLVPWPADALAGFPGRGLYPRLLGDAGISLNTQLPLSLVPDATLASLLSGSFVVAAFLAGYTSSSKQLKILLGCEAAMAMLQIAIGLLQASGGGQATLYFEAAGGRPIGTFANPNHLANYIAMALAGYVWLAWSSLAGGTRTMADSEASFAGRHMLALWVGGGLLLVLGVMMTQSRGAMVTGLPAAAIAVGVAMTAGGRALSGRATLLLVLGILAGAVLLVGIGVLISRFDTDMLTDSAEFRSLLTTSTIEAAKSFWPFGSGWGTYAEVYPRFQPASIAGFADYAHNDYAQMLLEGGVLALVLMGAFVWLAATRAVGLIRTFARHSKLNGEEMAAALCGLGLFGFLLHSYAEFNMHIPANAIAAALLAGAFLRPLSRPGERK